MTIALRQRCRNQHCRSKLPAPVENHHHAFCTRGCFESFYRNRCLVCEDSMRRKRESQKLGSGHKLCEREYRKFPRVYDFPAHKVPKVQISDEGSRNAHSTGIKFGIEGHPPSHHCLREWWWGDPGIGDLSLYDKGGLTLARIVLENGRYHLRAPVTWSRVSWPDLEGAKRGGESFALVTMSLDAVDPKLAARIKRDNETAHPMGPPLNRRPSRETAVYCDWKPSDKGATRIAPDIPAFLRRA